MHTRFAILAAAAAIASVFAVAPTAVAQTREYFRCDQNDEGNGPLHYIVRSNEMRIYRTPEQTRNGKGFLSANLCQEPGTTCNWDSKLLVLTMLDGLGNKKAFGVLSSGGLYGWNSRNGQKNSVLCEAVNAIPFVDRTERADWVNGKTVVTPHPVTAAQARQYFRCTEGTIIDFYVFRPGETRRYMPPELTGYGRGYLSPNMCQDPDTKCSWKDGLFEMTGRLKTTIFDTRSGLYSWNVSGTKGEQTCTVVDRIPYAPLMTYGAWVNGELVERRYP